MDKNTDSQKIFSKAEVKAVQRNICCAATILVEQNIKILLPGKTLNILALQNISEQFSPCDGGKRRKSTQGLE